MARDALSQEFSAAQRQRERVAALLAIELAVAGTAVHEDILIPLVLHRLRRASAVAEPVPSQLFVVETLRLFSSSAAGADEAPLFRLQAGPIPGMWDLLPDYRPQLSPGA